MAHYFPDGTPPVVTHTVARIERRLPIAGEVLVRIGSRVEPDDVVLRAALPQPPRLINIARELGILPRNVYSRMKKEEGNKVAQGELLARASILGGRSAYAPVAGTISAIDRTTGYVTITPNPVPQEAKAQVRGIVMEVPDQRTVIIETPSSYVQGIVGMGMERFGVLRLLVTDPRERVDAEIIDARSAYAILIAGASITAAALRRALEEQVRGIVVGGIEEHELRSFLNDPGGAAWNIGARSWHLPAPPFDADPGLTLVITEGFGVRPMSAPFFELLAAHDQQEALIEGATQLRSPQRRPKVIIPLSRGRGSDAIEPARLSLELQRRVRLLDNAHLGQIATVTALPGEPRLLPTGVRAPVVEVVLQDNSRLILPEAAVEPLAS